MSYTAGEKPGAGRYVCISCGVGLILENDTDTLSPCPKCNGTEFS